jgi:hypothetical protein
MVTFDETSKQLIGETRQPRPTQPGQPARYDYEYKRNGTRNRFLFCEPQAGWRHVAVTAQRTREDFARQMKWLVDERYPHAEVIRVVLDNLNTHKPGALYATFPPAEAHRLRQKWRFTIRPSTVGPIRVKTTPSDYHNESGGTRKLSSSSIVQT